MRQLVTTGIVLHRINYGEADRIITMLTPDQGKIRVIAKGVRKERSKLAGGIELFSISNITFIPGKRDIGTLVSARLNKNYGQIVKDLSRTMLGYDVLKLIDKSTQDECEPEFFALVQTVFESLDQADFPLTIVRNWFYLHLLRQLGHEPNLKTDATGQPLEPGNMYGFDYDHMAFISQTNGTYTDRHIKFMRLLLAHLPKKLAAVAGGEELTQQLGPLIKTMLSHSVR